MKKLILSFAASLLLTGIALLSPGHAQISNAVVVSACGTPPATYSAGANRQITQDTTGTLCTNSSGGGSTTVLVSPNSYAATSALASNKVVKGSSGTLYGFNVLGDATAIASTWYVLVFDATSLPADGAVTPVQCYVGNAGQPLISVSMPAGGVSFATGIVVGISSTGCFTQTTLGAHAFISGIYR